MFRLKSLEVLNLDPLLAEIILTIANHFDLWTITSAHRPGDSGVHGTSPLRGLDLRCRDMGVGEIISKYVNDRWEYDPERPEKQCCMFHQVSNRGWHLHFQVFPKSRRR